MGTEKQQNPKLELKLNEAAKLKLLRDKCYEGNSAYGAYFLYSVEHDGVEKSFFAPAAIHEQIVRCGLRAGSEFTLKKVAAQNGKKITGELVLELPNNQPAALSRQPANGTGNGHTDNLKEIMKRCLEDAVELTKAVQGVPFQNEDIRAISSCLFIARTKSNGFA